MGGVAWAVDPVRHPSERHWTVKGDQALFMESVLGGPWTILIAPKTFPPASGAPSPAGNSLVLKFRLTIFL